MLGRGTHVGRSVEDEGRGGWRVGAQDCQRPRDPVELGARTGLGALLLVSRPAPEKRVIQAGQSAQRWARGWGQGHMKLVAGEGSRVSICQLLAQVLSKFALRPGP